MSEKEIELLDEVRRIAREWFEGYIPPNVAISEIQQLVGAQE